MQFILNDLTLVRGTRILIRGLSFTATSGDLVHIQGSNGSGKTSLLRWLVGLGTADEGSVSLISERSVPIRFIGHDDGLDACLTISESLRLLSQLAEIDPSKTGIPDSDHQSDPFALSTRYHEKIHKLSRGWRRRVALHRLVDALGGLWILDEPFAHIDATTSATLDALIADHLVAGGIVILSTHTPLSREPSFTIHLPSHTNFETQTACLA